jgi:uncharacterized protein (TIGR03435 family)
MRNVAIFSHFSSSHVLTVEDGSGAARGLCNAVVLLPELSAYDRDGIDRPVVDLTDLNGESDFQFDLDRNRGGLGGEEGGRGGDATAVPDSLGPTIFQAMTQIGLELEQR